MKGLKWEIEVTQADIDKGCRGLPDNCPITRAVKRVFKTELVCTDIYTIDLEFRNVDIKFDTPQKVINWIERYDSGKKVKPFKFLLMVR